MKENLQDSIFPPDPIFFIEQKLLYYFLHFFISHHQFSLQTMTKI